MYEFKFKCACGTHTTIVRNRNDGEDIGDFLDNVIRPAMGRAHQSVAPLCRHTKVDLYLPAEDNKPVGSKRADKL